jgi:hypothetical protein
MARGGDEQRAATVAALGDLLTVTAETAPRFVRRELAAVAHEFERAARAPHARQADHAAAVNLHLAAQAMGLAGQARHTDHDVTAALALLLSLAAAAAAAYRWHQARNFAAQAASAGAAERHLRTAVEYATGAATAAATAGRGRDGTQAAARPPYGARPRPDQGPGYRALVRAAVAGLADSEAVLNDAAWPALEARLREAAATGHDPGELLVDVARARELGSADSVAQVLSWRVRGRLAVTAAPGAQSTAPQRQPQTPADPPSSQRPEQQRRRRQGPPLGDRTGRRDLHRHPALPVRALRAPQAGRNERTPREPPGNVEPCNGDHSNGPPGPGRPPS